MAPWLRRLAPRIALGAVCAAAAAGAQPLTVPQPGLEGIPQREAPPPAPPPPPAGPHLEVHAELQNLFLFRNDSDFDRTPPAYDANGQSVGAFATVFRPSITFHISDHLRLFYQAELGLNFWSRNNPDQQDPLAPDVFVLKHREVYAEGERGTLGFKAGYSKFQDPTGLFLFHWMGNAQLKLGPSPRLQVRLFGGQLPDTVYEGIVVGQNNFRRDVFVLGAQAEYVLSAGAKVSFGINGLYDAQRVRQERWLLTPTVHLEGRQDASGLWGFVDAALQTGQEKGLALGGGDQTVLAWALQAHGGLTRGRLTVEANALALSPDDNFEGNGISRAFLSSGKTRSATVMLTEDEIRDWYDNLDERMSGYRSGFFVNRAGLLVADAKASWAVTEAVRPSVIAGVATVLNPANALDNLLVGVEADAMVEVRLSDHLIAKALVGALLPGGAGAALINSIDLTRTSPLVMGEASLLVRY